MEEELVVIESDDIEEIVTFEESGTGGTDNYNHLNNKPKINDVELKDNKTSKDLGLQDEMREFTNIELEAMFSDL